MAEQITILGNYDKPPKVYLDDGRASGILIDIMKHIDNELTDSFSYELYPWRRAYHHALNQHGGIIGLSFNRERQKIFDYSDPLFLDEIVLVVLKGKEFEFEGIEDLKGKTIGAQRGSSYGDKFEAAKNTVFTLEVDDGGAQRLKKLLAKRIDAALLGPGLAGVEQVIASDPLLRQHKQDFTILPRAFKVDPNHLGFHKSMNKKAFLVRFNKALKQAHESGVIDDIVRSHTKQ